MSIDDTPDIRDSMIDAIAQQEEERLRAIAKQQQREKRKQPITRFIAHDQATGRRIIHTEGAAGFEQSIPLSNIGKRPGAIVRGFAGGADTGNVRREEIFRRRKKETEKGNTRVLCYKTVGTNKEIYVGGHIETPVPTGIQIPITINAGNIEWSLENLGGGDNDHLVAYSYAKSVDNRVIGVYNGLTNTRWEMQNAPNSLGYRGFGVFASELIGLGSVIPTQGNTLGTRDLSNEPVTQLLLPTYLGSVSGVPGRREIEEFNGSGYSLSVPNGIVVSSHIYNYYDNNAEVNIFYGNQSTEDTTLNAQHSSDVIAYRATSANLETLIGGYNYSEVFSSHYGQSVSTGPAFAYDDYFEGESSSTITINATYPCPVGVSGTLTGNYSQLESSNTPEYSWQHLTVIPAERGDFSGPPVGYQYPPDDFPPITNSFTFNRIRYFTGNVFQTGYYYTSSQNLNTIDPAINKRYLQRTGQQEVTSKLYGTPITTFENLGDFVVVPSAEVPSTYDLRPLVGSSNGLDYADNPTYTAESYKFSFDGFDEIVGANEALVTQRSEPKPLGSP